MIKMHFLIIYVVFRSCCMIHSLTGPWILWKLCIYNRGPKMKLSSSPLPIQMTKNANEIWGEQYLGRKLFTFYFQGPLNCFPSLKPLFLSLVTLTKVWTKWLNVSWWDFRRNWKEWRKALCSVWVDRWICLSSRPWTPKISAGFSQVGKLGCDWPSDYELSWHSTRRSHIWTLFLICPQNLHKDTYF